MSCAQRWSDTWRRPWRNLEDTRAAREVRARIDSGEERTYSHEEIWAEIEALEAKGELPA